MLGMRSRDRIYLFLAVVGLCCCTKAHSGGWCTGFSLAEASPLHRAALSAVTQQAGSGSERRGSAGREQLERSRIQAEWLWCTGLVAPRHVGSSRTRGRTGVPCPARWLLKYWTTTEAWGRCFETNSVGALCCCLIAQLYPALCHPMECSTPGRPVLHHLPELAQTHVHQVSNAIQPSRPLSRPSPPAFTLSQHQGLFQWVSSSHQVARVFSFSISPSNEYAGLFSLGWTGWISLQSRDSQESSPTPQFKSINSLALSFLSCPTLTSIHDHWKTHSFD